MMLTIISGGQTGADRTALEIAQELGIPTGGWCPLGCKTDDGAAPELVTTFGLRETSDYGYRNRTIRNVRDADATIWFGTTTSPGAKLTLATAHLEAERRPYGVLINPDSHIIAQLFQSIPELHILNVAGNRRRTNPDVTALVRTALKPALITYLLAQQEKSHG